MNTNSLLGLAVLGVGGFILWQMSKNRAAAEEADIMSGNVPIPPKAEEVADEYGQAIIDWSARFAGETLPSGDKLFEPLDISASNPLRLYYAIVKKRTWNGDFSKLPLTDRPDLNVGEIWLYNTATKREVRLDELAKQETMTADAKIATEQTFASAFVEACKINPQYHPWSNGLSVFAVKTGEKLTTNNREWHRSHCSDKYDTVM